MSSPPVVPQKSNNAVWTILGILGGIVVLLVLVGLATAGLIIRNINVRKNSNRVDVQTPIGEISVNKDAKHATGLPVYPGSTKGTDDDVTGGSADISLGSEQLGIAAESYRSADSMDAVKAWYRSNLGPRFRLEAGKDERVKMDRAHFDTGDQDWVFVDDRGDATSLVALKDRDDRVHITLLKIGKREAQ
jgi:hypothetical protein